MIKNSTIEMRTGIPEDLYNRMVAKVLEGEGSVGDFIAAAIERALDEQLAGGGMHVVVKYFDGSFGVRDRAGDRPTVHRNGKSGRQRSFSSNQVAALAAVTGGQWFYMGKTYSSNEILGVLLNG